MIKPLSEEEIEQTQLLEILRDRVGGCYEPGGGLEKAFQKIGKNYSPRGEQTEMADAIVTAAAYHEHAVIEAGTGVGKSLGYLIPLIEAAELTQSRVVISTHTINLQEQLINKDIPLVREVLQRPVETALVKGRSNYLCKRRLSYALRNGGDLFDASEYQELERLHTWAQTAEEGSLQELEQAPPPEVWQQVCAEEGSCSPNVHKSCAHCFLQKARKKMQESRVLIVNHHLLFSDLAIRMEGGGLLPDFRYVVFDEAHEMEAVASAHLGLRLSIHAFNHWMRRIFQPERRKGVAITLRDTPLQKRIMSLRDQVEEFFFRLHQWSEIDTRIGHRTVERPLGIDTDIPNQIKRTCLQVEEARERIEDEDMKAELKSIIRVGETLADGLDQFLEHKMENQVYWIELRGTRQKYLSLHSAPIEVAPILREALFKRVPSVIMTSATLAIRGELTYFMNRIGAEEASPLHLGSVFDYRRQMEIQFPVGMPEPNHPEFEGKAAEVILNRLIEVQGNAFVLFTSQRMMKHVAATLRSELVKQQMPLMVQNEQLSRSAMLEEFIKRDRAVLFGLDSFWAGVDVPGDNLRSVIITRLPFAVPDQPLIKARLDLIKARGEDPFRSYSLPEAILKMRQGVGRLIRSEQDRGSIVILDPRIQTKWYGRYFIKSLPDCPVREFVV